MILVSACGPAEEPVPDFSKDFLWGSAIAGFQADMGCPTLPADECEDRNSDWYAFVTAPETKAAKYMSGDAPSSGPGFWELYEQDLDRARNDLHLNGFRLSIEWSRLFPNATDGVEGYEALKAHADPKALAKYHAIFVAASSRGMKPLVTLNHYSLPSWMHDTVGCHADLSTCTRRGWLDKERMLREISKYAAFCAQEFGGEVDMWITQNEPLAVVLPGYVQPGIERANPPAVLLQFDAAKQVMMNMIEGHARMYDALKANDTHDTDGDGQNSFVGLVYAMVPLKGKTDGNRADQRAAENVFYLYNTVFLDGVIKGDLDVNLDKNPVHRDDLAGRMDFVGINYYTRTTVVGTNEPYFPAMSKLTTFDPLQVSVWEDYPNGLYEMAKHVKERYGLPSMITENGSAATENTTGVASGGTASSYLARHVQALKKARHEGIDVRGYFYWTFMDNYEWNHGMNIRMGLYAVDENDPQKTRTLRPAGEVYRKIVQANDVPADVAAEFPLQ